MSKKAVARVGDMTNHGGMIIAGSPTVMCDGMPVARVGDKVTCPQYQHGGVCTIITGSPTLMADGMQVAIVGSKTSCGAEILLGSPTRSVGGAGSSGGGGGGGDEAQAEQSSQPKKQKEQQPVEDNQKPAGDNKEQENKQQENKQQDNQQSENQTQENQAPAEENQQQENQQPTGESQPQGNQTQPEESPLFYMVKRGKIEDYPFLGEMYPGDDEWVFFDTLMKELKALNFTAMNDGIKRVLGDFRSNIPDFFKDQLPGDWNNVEMSDTFVDMVTDNLENLQQAIPWVEHWQMQRSDGYNWGFFPKLEGKDLLTEEFRLTGSVPGIILENQPKYTSTTEAYGENKYDASIVDTVRKEIVLEKPVYHVLNFNCQTMIRDLIKTRGPERAGLDKKPFILD